MAQPIADYASLKTSVTDWLHRIGEVGLDENVDQFIGLAEDELNWSLEILAMETSTTLADVTTQTSDLPADYRGLRSIYVVGNPNHRLDYLTSDSFWQRWLSSENGLPRAYTIEGGGSNDYTISFGPIPDGRDFRLLYWRKFEYLSDSNPTNYWTRNAGGLLLYGALLQASLYFSKPIAEKLTWSSAYEDLKNTIEIRDQRMRQAQPSPMAYPIGVSVA